MMIKYVKCLQVLLSLLLHLILPYFSKAEEIFRYLYDQQPLGDQQVSVLKAAPGGVKFAAENERFMFLEPRDFTPSDDEKFDFIVIGAGTAGATIATRLSEISYTKVLLIEAGRNESFFMDIPILSQFLQFSDDINWKYRTEPTDQYCRGLVDNRSNWPRGRVIGGSSILNFMIATRGDPRDYDNWAKLGNKGWAWKDVLPYFKKLETMSIPELRNNKKFHNDNGPVYISYPRYRTHIATAFLDAGIELGYKIIDYNGEEHVGFSYVQTNMKNGTRMSSNKAYLHTARNRPNLKVSKNSLVNKLLYTSDKKRVIGAEFIKRNKTHRVYATKEVILSAGSIGSPQILMLSGIGPAKHLEDNGIHPIVDALVG